MNAPEFLVVAVIGISLAAAVYAAAATWLRVMRDDHGLRLVEALEGQGIAQHAPESTGEAHQLAHAVRRCVTCVHHARCEAVLAKRDWQTLHAICPNAFYMERLRERG